MISPRDIDQLLLSFCDTEWLKVARIVGKSMRVLDERGIRFSVKAIDARLAALVRNKRLLAAGNIRKWRYSEVRLAAPLNKWQRQLPLSLMSNKRPKLGSSRYLIELGQLANCYLLNTCPRMICPLSWQPRAEAVR